MAKYGEAPKKRKKKKEVRFRTDPKKINLAIACRNEEKLLDLKQQSKVLKLVKEGNTFEVVGEKLGIAPGEALTMTKQAIDRWCGELSLDAKQNRELDVKRYDALLVILWADIEPKPLLDKRGREIIDPVTLDVKMEPVNLEAVKAYTMVMQRRAALLGLESDKSAVQNNVQINVIERRYIGANPDDL